MVEQRQRWLPEAIRATFELYRQTGERTWVAARGNSMRPLIRPGARLLVEFGTVPNEVGEIILFAQGEQLIAHRVVAWHQSRLIAKGDAEAYCDAPLEINDILGVVRAWRSGPDGSATSAIYVGWPARLIAHVSWWIGRGASLTRRAATLLPDPLRQVALRAIPPLARVAALALFAPITRAAQILALFTHGKERR